MIWCLFAVVCLSTSTLPGYGTLEPFLDFVPYFSYSMSSGMEWKRCGISECVFLLESTALSVHESWTIACVAEHRETPNSAKMAFSFSNTVAAKLFSMHYVNPVEEITHHHHLGSVAEKTAHDQTPVFAFPHGCSQIVRWYISVSADEVWVCEIPARWFDLP